MDPGEGWVSGILFHVHLISIIVIASWNVLVAPLYKLVQVPQLIRCGVVKIWEAVVMIVGNFQSGL